MSPLKFDPNAKFKTSLLANVAGVTHDNEDGISRQKILKTCKEGEKLLLSHTPVPEDPNAVKITRQLNGEQIGWLPASQAKEVADALDRGEKIDAYIQELSKFPKDGKWTITCKVFLTRHTVPKGCSPALVIAVMVISTIVVLLLT